MRLHVEFQEGARIAWEALRANKLRSGLTTFGIVIGIVTIAIAWRRFSRTARDIDSQDEVASPGERFDLALALMIGLLGASLALYLSRAVLPTI